MQNHESSLDELSKGRPVGINWGRWSTCWWRQALWRSCPRKAKGSISSTQSSLLLCSSNSLLDPPLLSSPPSPSHPKKSETRLSWICSKRCSQALGNVGAVANLPQMMKSDTRACFRRELSRWFVSLSWYFSTPSLSIFSSIEFTDRLLKATLTWYCFTVSFFPRDSRYPFSPTCRWEAGTHKWTPGRLLVQMQWGAQEFLFFLTKTILSQIDRESNEICSILKPSSDCFNLVSDGLIVGSRLWYGTINQVWVKSFWPSSNKYGPP